MDETGGATILRAQNNMQDTSDVWAALTDPHPDGVETDQPNTLPSPSVRLGSAPWSDFRGMCFNWVVAHAGHN